MPRPGRLSTTLDSGRLSDMLIRLTEDEAERLEALRARTGARSCTEVVRAVLAAAEGEDALKALLAAVREQRVRRAA